MEDQALMKTIVVGSGIIGASVAYHLAVRGAKVIVVTGDCPGGIATTASFAWINAAPGNSRSYFEFRLKAILDWHRLQRELDGALPVNWNGSLWWEDDMKSVEEKTWESTSWGYPMRVVSRAEAREQEPSLRQHPDRSVYTDSVWEGGSHPMAPGGAYIPYGSMAFVCPVHPYIHRIPDRIIRLGNTARPRRMFRARNRAFHIKNPEARVRYVLDLGP